MQQHSLRENSFRAVTHLKALRSSRSDNTFKGANLAGVLSASSSPITLSIVGKVSKSDRVDIHKIVVMPGANFPSYTYAFDVKGGSLKGEYYLQHPQITGNAIQRKQVLTHTQSVSGSDSSNPTFNETGAPMVLYIKFSLKSGKSVKYNSQTTYQPSSSNLFNNSGTDTSGFDDPFFDDPFFNDPFFN